MLRDVGSKLDAHLASMPNLPPVAWPNFQFDPPESGVYIVVMNMPADGTLYSFNYQQNTPGVYRINVYGSANKGPAEVENVADQIASHFRSNNSMGDSLFIEEINFSPAISDEADYMLPISINWRVFH